MQPSCGSSIRLRIKQDNRQGSCPEATVVSYFLLKVFCSKYPPMVTGRAARWRCHMWRSERPVGVNSTTTRKKRAEKVGSLEAAQVIEYYVNKIFYRDYAY